MAMLAKKQDSSTTPQTTEGYATYYGDKWHGRRAADGSVFSNDSLTCAHKTLPFGTILHVRNPKNGKEVVVRVTDRGPYRRNTLIDLSQAAAAEIDMIRSGVAKVEVTPIGIRNAEGADSDNFVPEISYPDPVTGKYYTLAEWRERATRKSEAKAAAQNRKARLTAKASRYRVNTKRATASARK